MHNGGLCPHQGPCPHNYQLVLARCVTLGGASFQKSLLLGGVILRPPIARQLLCAQGFQGTKIETSGGHPSTPLAPQPPFPAADESSEISGVEASRETQEKTASRRSQTHSHLPTILTETGGGTQSPLDRWGNRGPRRQRVLPACIDSEVSQVSNPHIQLLADCSCLGTSFLRPKERRMTR